MITKTLDVRALLSNPPRLHEDDSGKLISDWRIDNQTVAELTRRLRPGIRTVETGAGLSTILFAANGCRHTCIVPEEPLVGRIRAYCDRANIDHSNVEFIIAKSRDVVHQLTPGVYDVALVDGLHGFPTAYVDFCYLTLALRPQGILIIDDLEIFTCRSIADFMESDGSWRVEVRTSRFVLGVKLDETGDVDSGWGHPYVFKRSAAGHNAQGVFVDPSELYPIGYEPELVPTPEFMQSEGVETLEEWFRWGEEWTMALKSYGAMKRNSRVLEMACGLGRIAFPLRFQLMNGTYDGFDRCRFKIDFLRRRYQSRYQTFRFRHFDSQQAPIGESSTALHLPYADNAFDTVCAASVFTHLLPEAVRHYFQEIRRVLDLKGRASVGAFLLDHFRRDRHRPLGFRRAYFNFEYFPDPAYSDSFAVSERNNPESLTAYKQEVLLGFAAEAGLGLAEPIRPGMWSGGTDSFLLAEDLLVFQRER